MVWCSSLCPQISRECSCNCLLSQLASPTNQPAAQRNLGPKHRPKHSRTCYVQSVRFLCVVHVRSGGRALSRRGDPASDVSQDVREPVLTPRRTCPATCRNMFGSTCCVLVGLAGNCVCIPCATVDLRYVASCLVKFCMFHLPPICLTQQYEKNPTVVNILLY